MGGMGGGLALNQLLVVMDGIDNPPVHAARSSRTRLNAFLDAIYFVPRRIGKTWGRIFGVLVVIGGAVALVNGIGDDLRVQRDRRAELDRLADDDRPLRDPDHLRGGRGLPEHLEERDLSLRLPRAKPTGAQIYFIGATNVPVQNLDPALTRPGRMGRHITFRTPTKEDRKDIFDLYLDKVAHDPDLDTPERRDEMARITSGYSPAMIDQICSMALTNAHHEGRPAFTWEHLVDAMTVIESGTAVNVKYNEDDARAVAIHEAGHAAAAHVYVPEVESSRLSIKMRGQSLGHHQSFEKEERFGAFQSRMFGELDPRRRRDGRRARLLRRELDRRRRRPACRRPGRPPAMVGAAGMSPLPLDLNGKTFADETEEQTRERVMKRLEDIGGRLMNRTAGRLGSRSAIRGSAPTPRSSSARRSSPPTT